MLGIGGKFASSKGMVPAPDLSGLPRAAAITLLQSFGLRLGDAQSSNTSNNAQDQQVFQQNISPGQLIDYETPISFVYYNYVAPVGPTLINTSSTGCIEYQRYQISNNCNSSTKIGTITYGFTRRSTTTYFYSDGTSTSTTSSCTDSSRTETETIYNCDGSLDCNRVISRSSDTLQTSSCSSGWGVFTIQEFASGCGKPNSVTLSFCSANPNTLDCSICVSNAPNTIVYNGGCASGKAWYGICYHPSGCTPSQTETYGGCIPPPPPPPPAPVVCNTSCTPWYTSSCRSDGTRFVTRRCSDCNGNNEVRETYFVSC